MIFNNNTTATLGSMDIPVAEGYDCAHGTALALLELAESDYNMFKAMLNVEAKEMQLKTGSTECVNEAELVSLQEAAAKGIWNKIVELFTAFVGKVKAIFKSFVVKMENLFKQDAKMVQAHRKAIKEKDLSGMPIKWAKATKDLTAAEVEFDLVDLAAKWVADDKVKVFLGCDKSDFAKQYHDAHFEELKSTTMGEAGINIEDVMNYIAVNGGNAKSLKVETKKVEDKLTSLVKEAKAKAKSEKTGDTAEDASHAYDMAKAYQTAILLENQEFINAIKFKYKQNKAVFMKAAAYKVSVKKEEVEESIAWGDVLAEAAEDEVTNTIDGAINGAEAKEVEDLSLASKDAVDPGVSTDPNKLTYDKTNRYSEEDPTGKPDGTVDTEINSKKEAAFFGEMLY